MAKKAGYQLFVDSGTQVGHLGEPVFIGEEDFRRKQKEWYETIAEEQKPHAWGV